MNIGSKRTSLYDDIAVLVIVATLALSMLHLIANTNAYACDSCALALNVFFLCSVCLANIFSISRRFIFAITFGV